MVIERKITDDLEALLNTLPPHISQPLRDYQDRSELLEVILDLGRPAEARFPDREMILSPKEVTEEEIDYIVSRISSFGDDNRAGIERTLHRISAIRNRKGKIVGLTSRVGRAVFGTISIIQDLVESGNSILLLGRPGIGKTTMLREVARVLADDLKKRVIIVDTSNEIAGDGDIPHPAIGHARRMQVPTPTMQHAVMIEAVENHMPEVIIIDEIGTVLEAAAARTITERGVQLIGTAHGNTLNNLMMNPTLADLVGGIQTVTLGDEEARRRGTQKSILERKAPPTFNVVVEIQDRWRVVVHPKVDEMVDALLRGQSVIAETRWLDEEGKRVICEKPESDAIEERTAIPRRAVPGGPVKLYPFGISRTRLQDAARELRLMAIMVDDLRQAHLMITSKNYYRRKPQRVRDAEALGIPIYVVKSNTVPQMKQCLITVYPAPQRAEFLGPALKEAEEAIGKVMSGEQESAELSPQSAYLRRLQHLMAQKSNLTSRSFGKDPWRRVTIYKS